MTQDISIITPQFDRRDDTEISYVPDPEEFVAMPYMSEDTLLGLGLRRWNGDHFLFPHEWYDHIPEGFEVVDIMDTVETFSKETHNDDRRFGVLSYGIVRHDREGWQNVDESCMLCEMDKRTHWYDEDDYCVIADTLGTNPHPFVISKRHGEKPTQMELDHIQGAVGKVFTEYELEVIMAHCPDHWHAHIRDYTFSESFK